MLKNILRSRHREPTKIDRTTELERQYQGVSPVASYCSGGPVNDGDVLSPVATLTDLPFGQTKTGFAYEAFTPHDADSQSLVPIWVDSGSLALFELPADLLQAHSLEFRQALTERPDLPGSLFTRTAEDRICISNVTVGQFYDFAYWLMNKDRIQGPYKILEHHDNDMPYTMDMKVIRLVAGLDLGIRVRSNSFQNAIINDLHAVLLDYRRPEDIIARLFAATAGWALPQSHPRSIAAISHPSRQQRWNAVHPAKRMLIAFCAIRAGKSERRRAVVEESADECVDEIGKEFMLLFNLALLHMKYGQGFQGGEAFLLDELNAPRAVPAPCMWLG